MVRIAAAVMAGTMLLGSAAPTRAESFAGLKYLGGLSQQRRSQAGVLVLDGGQLRFEDRKGRIVFAVPLDGAKASVGAEKRTTFGSILRSSALMMVAIPLSTGGADPSQAWSRDTKPILVVELSGTSGGATLRWRGPSAELRRIADAINRAAAAATAPTE